MDKWEKIVTLQRELIRHKNGCTIDYLIERMERCNRSTVYRIKELAEIVFGVTIIRDSKSKKFRFDLSKGELTELPGLWFKKAELEALVCLQHAITGLQKGYMDELLMPFKNRFAPLLRAQGIDITAWNERFKILSIFTRQVDNLTFEIIADAVLYQKKVLINYRKLGQKDSQERVISPQTLVRYRDNWYVDAWCHLREDLRTFSLNRILSACKLKEKGKVIPIDILERHFGEAFGIFSGPVNATAEILFTGTAAYEVSQECWHPRQEGYWNDEHNEYRLKIPYGEKTELIMDILKWGDQAEVLKPLDLRQEIAEIIKNCAKKY